MLKQLDGGVKVVVNGASTGRVEELVTKFPPVKLWETLVEVITRKSNAE